jgi:anti-sigma-K factor RskA
MSEQRQCGMDAGAYVLGALSGPEEEAFRLHLAACEECRHEVDELESAAAALPLMAPVVQPPRALRRRVMSEIRADARARRRGTPSPAPAWRSWLGLSPLARGSLAGLLVLAIAVALTVGLSAQSPTGGVYAAVIAWHPGSAVVKVDNGTAELLISGMPAPPSGKVYEVWLQRGDGEPAPTSALFDVNDAGKADVDVPGRLSGVSKVMVTAEPDGGSRVPTESPILVATLS